MSDESLKQAIEAAVAAGVEEGLRRAAIAACPCGIKPDVVPEMSHLASMLIKDVGIEELRDHVKWSMRMRQRWESVCSKVGAAVVTIVVAALLGALWLGFETHLRKP